MARTKKKGGRRVNYLLSGDRFKKLENAAKAKDKDMTSMIEDLIDSLEVTNPDISEEKKSPSKE